MDESEHMKKWLRNSIEKGYADLESFNVYGQVVDRPSKYKNAILPTAGIPDEIVNQIINEYRGTMNLEYDAVQKQVIIYPPDYIY